MTLYILSNYHTHSSPIERMVLNSIESSLFTLGSGDFTLCQWDIKILTIEDNPRPDVEELYKDGIEGTTDAINREMQYAYNPLPTQNDLNGRGDPMVLVKGSKNKRMNDILAAAEEEEEINSIPKPPVGTLVLERVLGIQCGHRRNTLKYYYSLETEDTSHKDQLVFQIASEESPMEDESPNRKCLKYMSYYASRYVILYDPRENTQYIYDSHKARVTCVAIHPNGITFASGECSTTSSINCVHVWNSITRESIVILKTVHESGISLLDFSFDGLLLLTFGSGKQSLQVFNWEQEREIAFRHLNIAPIFDIRFDPLNSKNIIAIGLECILEISLVSGNLSVVNIITVPGTTASRRVFLCMDFIQYSSMFTNTINVFIGSSLGDVGVLSGSKFSIIPNVTHEGAINVLKISRIALKPFCMITGGDDDKITIWTSCMTRLLTIPIRGTECYKELERTNAAFPTDLGGVQSLDLCPYGKEAPSLLVGMRNGDVLEINLGLKPDVDKSAMSANMTGGNKIKLLLTPTMLMGEHSSQGMNDDERKLSICLHPVFPILVSGGYDCTLRFWDMSMNTLLRRDSLGRNMRVSALAFSPIGNLLTLGFTNGTVIFYNFNEGEKEGSAARYEPQIEKSLSTRDARGTVLLIKYSREGEVVAISYDAEIVVSPGGKKGELKTGKSCVIVYTQSNTNKSLEAQKSKECYSKVIQITFPIAHIETEHPSIISSANLSPRVNSNNDSELYRAFTHMDFSEDSTLLQLCYMSVSLHGKVDYSSPPLCLVWNLTLCQVVEDWETLRKIKWNQWSMAPTVYARILGSKLTSISSEEEMELLPKEEVVFSSLTIFNNYQTICAGSKDGDIHLFRYEALVKPNEAVSGEKSGMILKDKMEISKSYSACCSSIESIEIHTQADPNYILVSSSSDEVILKYRFECENIKWDLDYYTLSEGHIDPYSEFPPADRFNLIMKENWIPRSRIFELSEKLAPPPYPCNLLTNWIFGRRAYDRRNNLLYDYMGRVIYNVGTMLVMLIETDTKVLRQKVFPSTRNVVAFTSPEISCMCTNCDRHMIALGTTELKAHIYVWDISHDTEIGSVTLPNFSLVYCMKFAKDNRRIAAIGLGKDFRQMIALVDIQQQEILAITTLLHTSPYKIRDLEFHPDSAFGLVTAGIQHLAFWKTNGKYMESRCLNLTMTKLKQTTEFSTSSKPLTVPLLKYGAAKLCLADQLIEAPGTDPDIETVYVTFMGVGFIKGSMITIGDDGCIYIWNEERILKKKKAHEDCITCLHIESENELIVTGGDDGYVMVWGFNSGHGPLNRDVIQKASLQIPSMGLIMNRPIANSGNTLPAATCVQSVWLNKEGLLVGIKNGAIYKVEAKISFGEFKLKSQSNASLFNKILDATDEEIPKCISYDSRNKRLLCISQKGFLSVWSLETNLLVTCKNFARSALYLYAFATVNSTLVAFENEVNMLNDNYDILEDFSIKKSLITAIKICNNEKVIAVASSNAKTPELEIYDIENKFHEFHSIKGYKANIMNIDFTIDGRYLICQNELSEVYIYDRETLERIESSKEDIKLNCEGFGLTIDPSFEDIYKHYSSENKIYTTNKFPNRNIVVVGDQIGSVRFLIMSS